MRTFEIQLRTEDLDEEKLEILREACREKAREIYAIAFLIKETRDPQIMFSDGDLFEKNKDLEILSAADLDA
jgi:hypothetical protein